MLRFRSKISVSDALARRDRTLFRIAATAASGLAMRLDLFEETAGLHQLGDLLVRD
ncbi:MULTISPECIES: hypothetical protein [unclassified Mesorhizobium]|uniref:hypothetical protein n=1 Tax=unclassified Mesorhizobium TaxID=325217 RepID=UPI00042095B6|nr:hypothetical protein [Mesorhizobium sp. LSJC280B00]